LSLGEYTALYAAGCLSLADALRLVARRGAAMQAAATAVPSGMLSVMGLDEAKAQELCQAAAEGQVLVCANFNCPGQVVLSGQVEACRRAAAKAPEFGASGAVMLAVAGAFHSRIMQPAAKALQEALAEVDFQDPQVEVVANVDASPYDGKQAIKAKLVGQLTRAVRWQQSMEYLIKQGISTFYEIGPGRVLAGLMRRIDRKANVACVNSRQAIEELAQV
jgi:[acyl-carrier-protein] S-malonyltransferase